MIVTNLLGLIKRAVGSSYDGQTTIDYVLVIVLIVIVLVLAVQAGLLGNVISATVSKFAYAITG